MNIQETVYKTDILKVETELFSFNEIKNEITEVANKCSNLIVNDNDNLKYAKELAKISKNIKTTIEEKRKELTAPLLTKQREYKKFADDLTAELDKATKQLREQILNYEQEQERKRQEEFKKIEAEKERLRQETIKKELEIQAANNILQDEEIAPEIATQFIEEKQAEIKKAEQEQIDLSRQELLLKTEKPSIRKIWDWELVDINSVPIYFLQLNPTAIKQAMSEGIREIAGLRIYQKEISVIR